MYIFIIKHCFYKWHWDYKIRKYFYLSNCFENQGMPIQE